MLNASGKNHHQGDTHGTSDAAKRTCGAFPCSAPFPLNVSMTKAARCTNGVLTVRMPKMNGTGIVPLS